MPSRRCHATAVRAPTLDLQYSTGSEGSYKGLAAARDFSFKSVTVSNPSISLQTRTTGCHSGEVGVEVLTVSELACAAFARKGVLV